MEERAKEKERTIRILAEAIPDPVMLLDHNRQILALNDAMAQRFGYKYTQIYGNSAIRFDRNGIFTFIESRMNELLNSGHPLHFEEKDGEAWYEISFILIPASEGQHHNFFVQFHDITNRRKFEEQLKKEGITQIEQNMEQFQILNDQIRNPLQAIMGYVSLDCIQYRARILEQIMAIDSLVKRLDKGWVESEKVRGFLLRHYWDKLDDSSDSMTGSNEGGHSRWRQSLLWMMKPAIREIFTIYLEMEGYKAVAVPGGRECLEYLKTEKPDLNPAGFDDGANGWLGDTPCNPSTPPLH